MANIGPLNLPQSFNRDRSRLPAGDAGVLSPEDFAGRPGRLRGPDGQVSGEPADAAEPGMLVSFEGKPGTERLRRGRSSEPSWFRDLDGVVRDTRDGRATLALGVGPEDEGAPVPGFFRREHPELCPREDTREDLSWFASTRRGPDAE